MSTPYFVEMINYIDDNNNNNNTYNTTRHVTCQFQERERESGTDRVTKRERDIEIETERGGAEGERGEIDNFTSPEE